ncbi:hypothetical protein ABG768_013762, partial [Culter alburnus]
TQGNNQLNHYHHSSFTLQELHGSCVSRERFSIPSAPVHSNARPGSRADVSWSGRVWCCLSALSVSQHISTQLNWGQVSHLRSELTVDLG